MQANRHHGKLQTWQCKVNCTGSSSIARVCFRSRILGSCWKPACMHALPHPFFMPRTCCLVERACTLPGPLTHSEPRCNSLLEWLVTQLTADVLTHHAVGQRILLVQQDADEEGIGSGELHVRDAQERCSCMGHREGHPPQDAAHNEGLAQGAVPARTQGQQQTLQGRVTGRDSGSRGEVCYFESRCGLHARGPGLAD